jgi:ribosome maturation factor RimP
MDTTARIAQILEEKYASDEAFQDCFTVEIELRPGNKLYIFADSDSGMTFEKCQKLSRHLESFLDTELWLGDKYLLEVSSPGIGRPLKFPRQYKNNAGRTLAVTMKDKTQLTGLLKSATDEHFVLETKTTEREGNKKKEVVLETPVLYENVEKAIVKLAF